VKKTVLILVVLLAASLIVWRLLAVQATSENTSATSAQPQLVPVKRGPLSVVIDTTGRVVPDLEVEIKCKASGEVIKLPVDVSETVKKGDLLVQLDPENEERSVKRAEVALAVSQARWAQAKLDLEFAERSIEAERIRVRASLQSAKVKEKDAEAKLERVRHLSERKMVSREELDSAQTVLAQTVADLENAGARAKDLEAQELQLQSRRQDILIAEAQVESDKLSLSDAKQRLADTTVVAPIDGIVASRNVQNGQIIASGISNVGGGTPVMTLLDLSRVFVLASVDESDIGRIETGQRARVTVDAHPDAFLAGEVIRVATKGTSTSNVVTFEVKVEIKGPNRGLLKPEMTANVEIMAVEKEDILLVPVTAVERRRRERFVTVLKPDGLQEVRTVQTGASDGEVMEIVKGLSEGETVLIPKGGGQGRWRVGDQEDGGRRRSPRMPMMGRGPRR